MQTRYACDHEVNAAAPSTPWLKDHRVCILNFEFSNYLATATGFSTTSQGSPGRPKWP